MAYNRETDLDSLDWSKGLERLKEQHQQKIDPLPPDDAGNYIHALLKDEFDDLPDMDFESKVHSGRADLITDSFVYEFKTRNEFNIDQTPAEDDVEQLQRYLHSGDVDLSEGLVVYINRDDISEIKQFRFEPDYNTNFVRDGELPDTSQYEIYEVLDTT
jgi:hypothetical protein